MNFLNVHFTRQKGIHFSYIVLLISLLGISTFICDFFNFNMLISFVLCYFSRGHFAVVKRCLNKQTGISYAGKFIRKRRVCRGAPIEDIEREIETLSRMEHPGIIKFHDVYDTGQNVVLLLELYVLNSH